MQNKQTDFFKNNNAQKQSGNSRLVLTHGGSHGIGRRKTRRPLDSRRSLHLILKSRKAKGTWSLLNHRHRLDIERLIRLRARKYGVKVHHYANVGNHLHLLLSFASRRLLQNYFRLVAGMIARMVTGAKRGNPKGIFWEQSLWTRVVSGRRDFINVKQYIDLNQTEAFYGSFARQISQMMKSFAKAEWWQLYG